MNLRQVVFVTLLTNMTLLIAQEKPASNLMPVPASVSYQSGRLSVDPSFQISVTGYRDDRLLSGVQRAMRRMEGRTGFPLPRKLDADQATAKLVIQCKGPGQKIQSIDEDESYELNITAQNATLKSNTAVGALRGLETLLQLLSSDSQGYFLPAVTINDTPRFRWRGLLIDVGRHYEPMDVLKRNLDAMAAVKLNVLHWHLTEDQGFRIESKKYPKLHQMGSEGQFYTQAEAREIIEYARQRGIRVVPEFDMPGHVASWLVGHPELAAAPGPHELFRRWGVSDGSFDPTQERVYKLIDGFLGEMADLFPDAYLHIGGDENNGKWWTANPSIQEFMKRKGLKDNHALQTYFNQRLLKILQKHGKRMMGWDEIFHPDLPKDVMIQSWRNSDALAQTAKQGYDGILSAPYYIDLLRSVTDHYQDVIAPGTELTDEQRKHILGGEATMWAEWVTGETIDSRIWPRTAAIAEKFWSPSGTNDVDDMFRRLQRVSSQLEELGLAHKKNQAMMLRRMAGTDDIAPLETLLSVVEPVKGYRRNRIQTGVTTFTPLTRLVDAANVDSVETWRFRKMVDTLLNDAPRFETNVAELQATFQKWKQLDESIKTIAANSPLVQDAVPLAKELSQLGDIGLESLKMLHYGETPAPDWEKNTLATLEQMNATKIPLEFSMMSSMRELVTAAAERPQLKDLQPQQWRERVRTLAAPPVRKR